MKFIAKNKKKFKIITPFLGTNFRWSTNSRLKSLLKISWLAGCKLKKYFKSIFVFFI